MRIKIFQLSLLIICLTSYFFVDRGNVHVVISILLSIAVFIFSVFHIVLSIDDRINKGNLYFGYVGLKRIYSAYGVFYIKHTNYNQIALFRDRIFYFIVEEEFDFEDIETLKSSINTFLDKKYKSKESKSNSRVHKELSKWDGYTNTVDSRDDKIKKLIN